jgi:membrane protein implicated in regulation of membrane protease activity
VFSIYIAAATFGLLFVLWGFIAGDPDVTVDDAPGATDGGGLWALFSIRSLAFGALIFGVTGALGNLGGWGWGLSLAVASVLGVLVWTSISWLFAYLKRTESGAPPGDSSWMGTEARLVVPFGGDGVGRIEFMAGGQLSELAARRSPDFSHAPPDSFHRCIIDQVVDGTALISPLSLPSTTDSHG